MAPTATFAQLCQDLTLIEDAEDHHVFELYKDISTNSTYPFSQFQNGRMPMPSGDFINLFYSPSSGNFSIRDCCNNIMLLTNWKALDYPFVNPATAPTPTDPSYNSCDILTLVPQQWVVDLSHNSTCCWTACSYMNIMKELLAARNICNLHCDVCCSMTAQELADILNHQDPTITEATRRTASAPTQINDIVILAVLFTNPHPSAKPIELRLNFVIDS